MKKLAVTVTLTVATLASSSAAFADEINTDVVTTDKHAQPVAPTTTQTPSTTSTTSSPDTTATSTTSTTTTTSAPVSLSTPTDRPSYELKENRRPNRPLLITGSAIFVGTYATTAIVQAANNGPDTALYIPVVGPWLHLADREGNQGTVSETLLIGGSGVLQGVGVAMMLSSFIIPEKRPVGTISAGPVKMMIGPGVAAGTF